MPDRVMANAFFPYTSRKDWANAAQAELGHDVQIENLTTQVDGIDLLPYYDASDLPDHKAIQLPVAANEYNESRHWASMPRILVKDPRIANEQALSLLNDNADGIFFELTSDCDSDELLKNIDVKYCVLSFLTEGGHRRFAEKFFSTFSKNKNINGTVFLADGKTSDRFATESITFHDAGLIGTADLPVVEDIAVLLAKAVTQIESLIATGSTPLDAIQRIAFLTYSRPDFFLEIARLKAMRQLWMQVANAYSPGVHNAHIHSVCPNGPGSTYQPHRSMIAGTLNALSSVLGGCDALTVDAEDDKSMHRRIAANVSAIIREESFLGKVADPTAGTYLVEHSTDQIAQLAWQSFQRRIK